jgi:hypothetical protein
MIDKTIDYLFVSISTNLFRRTLWRRCKRDDEHVPRSEKAFKNNYLLYIKNAS